MICGERNVVVCDKDYLHFSTSARAERTDGPINSTRLPKCLGFLRSLGAGREKEIQSQNRDEHAHSRFLPLDLSQEYIAMDETA